MPSWWKCKAPIDEDAKTHARRLSIRRKHYKRNRAAHRAHAAVYHAVKAGALTRPANCEECGIACRPEAHHADYDRPLDVTWLCLTCHGETRQRTA